MREPPRPRTIIEPFKIKVVEPLAIRSRPEREGFLARAGWNLFQVPSESVTFDFLTDSGTSAMSAAQWGAMMVADESYAGSRSFARFEAAVRKLTGYPHVIPTHQGRAAERLLFSLLIRPGCAVPSNNHFDTTRANIEQLGGEAVDLVVAEGRDPASRHPFKGNVDLARLDRFCAENRARIPLGMLTITNNTGGGQPVSLANLHGASEVYRRHGIPFVLDACRFAENSYLVKLREDGQGGRSPREIARETFELADGCLVSAKKDGLVNIGGFLALRDDRWVERARSLLILTEGFPTYGGLAARDLEALAVGLEEVLDERYLDYRLAVTRYLAEGLNRAGIPTVQPPGGHAVYVDARALLPHVPPERFPGQALACEMYLAEGIRACEIGSVMFGRNEGGSFRPAAMELVRLAIPRRVYTQSHVDYVIEGMAGIAARIGELRGLRLVRDPPYLRHFTASFEPV
ncbi:MAG: tryptophanase [Planctomycetales bacterium]|nr:tryptophanase [Planctomycetales bacterium]